MNRPAYGFRSRTTTAALSVLRASARALPRLKPPSWLPWVGRIGAPGWAPPLMFSNPSFGPSMTLPSVLKISIDSTSHRCVPEALAPLTYQVFENSEPFDVNVAFACGRAPGLRPGVYADPRSQWFNIFAGCYEIDVDRSRWGRPFGYTADRSGFRLHPTEIARLGQADWNYFSNYLYGVPLDVLETLGCPPVKLTHRGRHDIAGRTWDRLGGDGIEVSSAFVSTCDGGRLDLDRPWVEDLWRAAFGQPYRAAEPDRSFFTTAMSTELLVCWDESVGADGLPIYRTFVFGGAVNQWWAGADPERIRSNAAFLQHQVDVLAALIADRFGELGFEPGHVIDVGGQPGIPPATEPPIEVSAPALPPVRATTGAT